MADVMRSPGPDEEPAEEPSGEETAAERGDRTSDTGTGSAGKGKKRKKGSFWWELFVLVGTALVLTVLLQMFVARVFVIPSQSMMDTLHGCPGCNNDRILVDKITYRFSDPQPGDVVVFSGPDSWMEGESGGTESANPVVGFFRRAGALLHIVSPGEKDFVKRVIATGGQTVECCDPQNRVLVDGEPLDEPYIHWSGESRTQEEFGPVTVPEDHLWVMGDNRNNSLDSRYQGGGGRAGAVPVDDVIGKAQFVVLPLTRWQSIYEENPQTRALGAASEGAANSSGTGGLGYLTVVPAAWAVRRGSLSVTRADIREYH
ncbi:signal peptidase I [Actinopolyspora mortivallis]|uniref:signal peptidase I n=1 Tax=Actinopolyspora mortivallis TaxID=33906 RepID=UPI00038273C0